MKVTGNLSGGKYVVKLCSSISSIITGVTRHSTGPTEVVQGANCRVQYRVGLVSVIYKLETTGVAAKVPVGPVECLATPSAYRNKA